MTTVQLGMPAAPAMRRRASRQVMVGGVPVGGDARWSSYTDAAELFAGDHLLHTEWSPGNVVINDGAQLVDWAWPTRGAAWIDPACWVVWMVASGHSPRLAENCAARISA